MHVSSKEREENLEPQEDRDIGKEAVLVLYGKMVTLWRTSLNEEKIVGIHFRLGNTGSTVPSLQFHILLTLTLTSAKS